MSYTPSTMKILDTVAESQGETKVSTILSDLKATTAKITAEDDGVIEKLKHEVDVLRKELAVRSVPEEVEATGEIPSGRCTLVDAGSVFGFGKGVRIPQFEWESPHPHVPAKRAGYVLREELVLPVLYSLLENEKCWLTGHTGTGKTTLIEQVCAHLNWPFMVINFDSEITRSELIGKPDLIADESGATVTQWSDGILPMAMEGPYVLCLDELDFVRPDVSYVMQRALEGNGLRILEDNGREVKPHAMFRMFATGNTKGQGDPTGLYQGARPQSTALLDRFTTWVEVPYMTKDESGSMLSCAVPELGEDDKIQLLDFTIAHRQMFVNSEVTTPNTPRSMVSIAKKVVHYKNMDHPLKTAVKDTLINRASSEDMITLNGLIERFC